ncbi:uncharacterized protein LOC128669324 [Plodia interpunctella]|uniref:uncharacterized protein LOC128669324 n=1 Tax=Plodia interpunctella TaxID=58824 RepID=UPI002367537E|nr:uncharacterized protein LOC128669324 [Plodia interpunctella]XP_053600051.1 uncharacterized protein LOC128669324 [Plodia interpunctella]XP_053600052.1 uncharacterized protein LOC128669324 [Plodia interpunctella]XP_053600053.1 uncharacterized protein LOC128669324 [Plodia interpunctella]
MAAWVWLAALLCGSHAAVLPPPWADVRRNPCAAHPRGWLMLYWPSDGKCYTIYKKGYPCPETQELSPGRWGGRTVAECKCPPGTAQLPHSTTCHKLFDRGPCRPGEYFAPVEESFNKRGERQGMCMRPQQCADETLLFWPADGRCYYRLSQGPCYSGSILDIGEDGLANCTCATDGPHFYSGDGGCYAHYSRGPCDRGQLFLPGSKCGCEPHLPHYHNETGACYELDGIGPCPKGHVFSINEVSPQGSRAECTCKSFHARASDGACYRLYTRGPCASDEMISRGGRCTKLPCARGRLYVPSRRRCYRPGAAEPCPRGEVVAFDFEARPALDGLSHNGVCACGNGACTRKEVEACSFRAGSAVFGGACHTLHTQGPCPHNSWLTSDSNGSVACRCRPGTLPPDCRLDGQVKS